MKVLLHPRFHLDLGGGRHARVDPKYRAALESAAPNQVLIRVCPEGWEAEPLGDGSLVMEHSLKVRNISPD